MKENRIIIIIFSFPCQAGVPPHPTTHSATGKNRIACFVVHTHAFQAQDNDALPGSRDLAILFTAIIVTVIFINVVPFTWALLVEMHRSSSAVN